jgi:putative SOS response-associated peptidase YedK
LHQEQKAKLQHRSGRSSLDIPQATPHTAPMCGRYASYLPHSEIAALFRTQGEIPNLAPNWNIAPTHAAPVIRAHPETGERGLHLLRWGLVPHFTKDLKAARQPINARAETVATSGMFRGALAYRRCLVPADAFYEWKAMADGKQPYAISRVDGAPLAFAGIWEGWRSPDGEALGTFAIITTSANADMAVLHDRMPVILEPADWPAWLERGFSTPVDLLRPAAVGVARLWPVSRAVNSVRNNGPELLDRIDDPHASPPSDAPAGENPA